MSDSLRDRWMDFWHALPPFRGRLALARLVAKHVLSGRSQIAWARLPNGYRAKVDLRWYDSLYYFRTYEGALTRLIRHTLAVPSAEFVDVGANVGVFSLQVADLLVSHHGRALAIEPMPENAALLRDAVTANGLEDVVFVAQQAVGDRTGTLRLCGLQMGSITNAVPIGWSGRKPEELGGLEARTISEVSMSTIDLLVDEHGFEHVGFVKIDIEGAELFALRGAERLLKRQRPVVYAELHRDLLAQNGGSLDELRTMASDGDFAVRFLDESGRLQLEPRDPKYLHAVLVPQGSDPIHRALLEGRW